MSRATLHGDRIMTTVICNECDYPAELTDPWRCPNPACSPGDAARRASRRAWEAMRDRWVREQGWVRERADTETFRPWPAGAAFPVADPPWRKYEVQTSP